MNIGDELNKYKALFDDAEIVKFTLTDTNCNIGVSQVRRWINPDYCIMFYERKRDIIQVIVSEQAKNEGFPEANRYCETVQISADAKAKVGYVGKAIQVTFPFSLHQNPSLLKYIEDVFFGYLYRISFYDEVNMSAIVLKGTTVSDVVNTLSRFY